VNFAGKTSSAYKSYINQRMKTQKVRGKKIEAWAIGIPGKDVMNTNDFIGTLDAVSSSPDHIAYLDDMSEIEQKLIEIGNNLSIFSPNIALTFNTPAYPSGTSVRLTFDNASYAKDSGNYIEGKISGDPKGSGYSLTNIRARGVNLKSTGPIKGRRTDRGDIEFTVTVNNNFEDAALMEWYNINPYSGADWLANSEFLFYKDADFTNARKSSIVYLVLDCSSSLSPAEIKGIRKAVSVFTGRLFDATSNFSGSVKIAEDSAGGDFNIVPASVRTAPPPRKRGESRIQDECGEEPSVSELPPEAGAGRITVYQTTVFPESAAQRERSAAGEAQAPLQTGESWQTTAARRLAEAQRGENAAERRETTALRQEPARRPAPAKRPGAVQYRQEIQITPGGTTVQSYSRPGTAGIPGAAIQSVQTTTIQTSPPPARPCPPVTVFLPAKSVNWADPYAGFWVQTGSFTELRNAQNFWRGLYKAGCGNAEIFGKNMGGRLYYRVKVGPYQNRRDAETARNILRNTPGFTDAFIDEHWK